MSVQSPAAVQVVEIPLSKIRLNPRNPRKVIKPGQVEAKAASLKAIGLETPIKVRPLTEEEKQADPAHEYELIGGELRFRAAQSLGWPTLSAYVLEAKPGDIFRKALMDNMNQEMFWLDRYEAMEGLKKADTSLTNQALADMLEIVRPKVSRVLALMGVLSDSARAQVRTLSTTTPDLADFLDYFETAALELGALGDLPGTANQTEERVEACLKVAIDRRMTIAQVKRLVAWVKEGKAPEAFGQTPKQSTPSGEKASLATGVPSSTPAQAGPKGNGANPSSAPQPGSVPKPATPNSSLLTSNSPKGGHTLLQKLWFFLDGHLGHGKLKTWLGGGLLGALFGFLAPNLKRVLGLVARRYMVQLLVALGVAGYVGTRMYGHRYNTAYPQARAASQPQNAPLTQAAPAGLTPHAQNLVSNHPNPEVRPSAPTSLASSESQKFSDLLVVPPEAKEDTPLALEFARHYYGVTPQNWNDTQMYFYYHMDGHSLVEFVNKYKTEDFLQQNWKQKKSFSYNGTQPEFVYVRDGLEVFCVKGEQTRMGDEPPKPRPVILMVYIQHHPDGKSLVMRAIDLSYMAEPKPEKNAESAKGEDPLKAVGDAVKDANSTVNTAQQGEDAVDKAKKMLGF